MLDTKYTKNATTIATAVFAQIVPIINAINDNIINNGDICNNPINIEPTPLTDITEFVLWLYSIIGEFIVSNPYIIPENIVCIIAIIIIEKIKVIKQAIIFDANIFLLLYGLINNSFIVPLLNSSLTIPPVNIKAIIITNNIPSPPSVNNVFNVSDTVAFELILFSILYLAILYSASVS